MKKTLKSFGLLFALTILVLACKDEMSNESFKNGSATITGVALVNLDLTNDTMPGPDYILYEYVPQGTRIYARINSEDLVEFPSDGVDYGDIEYDTVVGASGAYSFEVAANISNVTVTFSSDDFIANQIQPDTTVEPRVFYLPEIYTVTVNSGITRISDLTFLEKTE
jgi:hypothetical protein